VAVVIRSPEVTGKARLLSSKASVAEQSSASLEEKTHAIDKESKATLKANTDAVYPEKPARVVTPAEVEQVYSQYQTDHQYNEEIDDISQREIEKYRIEIDDLQKKIQLLEDTIEEKKSSAVKEGFDKGYAEGETAARELFNEKLQQLEALLTSFEEIGAGVLESQEDAMVEIVVAAVTKILGEKFVTPEGTVAAVRSAMSHVTQRDHLLFRVAPDDYELLNEHKPELYSGLDQSKAEFVADEKVKLGGCILENKAGSIDKRLEVQLQSFIDTLIRVRNQRRSRES
jgi:flagellar assembly protein FliH